MKEAFSKNDPVSLSREAHGVKGSSSNLGADQAASLCKEIERIGKSNTVEGAKTLIERLESELETIRQEYQSTTSRKNPGPKS